MPLSRQVEAGTIENSRFQPRHSVAGLREGRCHQLEAEMGFGVPNATAMYGQPAIAGGRLFVGSDNAVVYALNAEAAGLLVVPGRGGDPHRHQRRGDHGPAGARVTRCIRRPQRRGVRTVNAETGTLVCKVSRPIRIPWRAHHRSARLYRGRLCVPVTALRRAWRQSEI